jgi:hypothetical protein
MKQHPFKFKLFWDGIEWGQSAVTLNSNTYFYYFYWWNFIIFSEDRKWGFDYTYYDGPHHSLWLWYICLSWSTPWSKCQ